MNKKMVILSICFSIFLIAGCQNNKNLEKDNYKFSKNDEVIEKNIESSNSDSLVKLALYEYNSGKFTKKEEYFSPMEHYKDIAVFSVIYTDEDILDGYSIKDLWNEHSKKYDNISDYKLGYEISFTLDSGEEIHETILKPLEFSHFSFSNYLYVWLYDDINQTDSWYNHLEENEYNEKTIMSSIKLMSVEKTDKIATPINLTVFVYKDENDFDKTLKYIGNNKFTMLIKRK